MKRSKIEQCFYCSIGILTDSTCRVNRGQHKKDIKSFFYCYSSKKKKVMNITQVFYEYGKFLYFIDGEQTDELSQIKRRSETSHVVQIR
jgi:hypothetical protein